MIRNVLETLALWSVWRDSNSRHHAPKAKNLETVFIYRTKNQQFNQLDKLFIKKYD